MDLSEPTESAARRQRKLEQDLARAEDDLRHAEAALARAGTQGAA
jgi:hypothetical protein